jgi:uncharacterized protein YjiS (DUF1127 family)
MKMILKGKTMFASVATSTMTIRRVEMQSTLGRLAETLRLGMAAQRQRQALGALDTAALADIGLSLNAAKIEANRPFWDIPGTWRR